MPYNNYYVLVDGNGTQRFEVRFETRQEAERALRDIHASDFVGDQFPILTIEEVN